jgi:hypothetical protein
LEFIVSEQVEEVPEQTPDHPEKTELESGVALRVTVVPAAKDVPDGLAVIVPVPVPILAKFKE